MTPPPSRNSCDYQNIYDPKWRMAEKPLLLSLVKRSDERRPFHTPDSHRLTNRNNFRRLLVGRKGKKTHLCIGGEIVVASPLQTYVGPDVSKARALMAVSVYCFGVFPGTGTGIGDKKLGIYNF